MIHFAPSCDLFIELLCYKQTSLLFIWRDVRRVAHFYYGCCICTGIIGGFNALSLHPISVMVLNLRVSFYVETENLF